MDARHTFTSDAPCFPLHAVDPEEQDSPWAIEPAAPIDVLHDFVNDIWGPGRSAFLRRHQNQESGR